jgi:hypothetical protein
MKANRALAGDAMVTRGHDLLTAEVDGELIAMSVDRGLCYGLNEVGTRIWALIGEPRSIDSLCEQLVREFEVDEALCRAEVIALIEDLRAESLVSVAAP